MPLNDLWSRICAELQQVVSPDAVERWFRPLQPERFEGGILTLKASNSIYQFWIEENYLPQLLNVAGRILAEFGHPTSTPSTKTGKTEKGHPKRKLKFTAPTRAELEAAKQAAKDLQAAQTSQTSPTPPPAAAFLSDAAPSLTEISPAPSELPLELSSETAQSAQSAQSALLATGLNPRHSFDLFVVGPNNEFAAAAAKAVADAPARNFNPLFIHGSVGLGKTHLMQAIGNHLSQKRKHFKIRYVTSEQFTNEFIAAIQHGELAKFRKRYRQVDALLIDDVQFLAGKDRSQEEFFHTFNSLFDGSKQIVMSCDSPPSEITNIEKRLSSRFESGLTAEILLPGIETRLAILRHKRATMKVTLPDEILTFIADRVKTNVRRLEGALTRVGAYASLHGRSINLSQIESLLKDLLQHESPTAITIDAIQRKVAETFDIRLADMTSKRRPANIAVPRMVAMYLSRRFTSCSLAEIGDAFGGRDHGTVIHAQKTIDGKMKSDARLNQQIEALVQKLGQ